jgi:hypothetical protein
MRRLLKISLFLINFPCIAHSQKWKEYSDSIIQLIQVKFDSAGLHKANEYIQLADLDIANKQPQKDTIYADYLYRKGFVKYNLGEFSPLFFEEAIYIWEKSSIKNYTKLMKCYYFSAASYHLKKEEKRAYDNYEKCYQINQNIKLPQNQYYINSIYYLAVIDYNSNLNYKKAEKYSSMYIEINRENAIQNFDFNYPYAYKWKDDTLGFTNALLDFKKSYDERKINDIDVYSRIHYELAYHYFNIFKPKECIIYAEKCIEILQDYRTVRNENNYLNSLYQILTWAYSEVKDELNKKKYEKLIKK